MIHPSKTMLPTTEPTRPGLFATAPRTRRDWLKQALATGAAVSAPAFVPGTALGRDGGPAASERIVMGAIGTGGQGTRDLLSLLGQSDVRVVAVCDVHKGNREAARNHVNARYGNQDCTAYRDLRELLAKPGLDAVLIATGDRWHAPASILAMQAGLDVYCEKPGAMTIAEGQALEAAATKHHRVFQTGAQRASEANYILAGELARQGRLGRVQKVHAHLGYLPDWPRVNARLAEEPEPPKDELDWDLWLGPSPWRPFNPAYLRTYPAPGWYTQYDFAGGIAQWGSHTILQCQLDLGLAGTSAIEYHHTGDIKGAGMRVRFAGGLELLARCDGWRGSCGVKYEGEEGWVATADGYAMPEVSKPTLLDGAKDLLASYAERTGRPRNHMRDFLDSVKSRREPVTNAAVARHTMTTNLIMDMCLDLRRDLKWDPAAGEFPGDAEANALRARTMRPPWRI
jgi:hypothetical protein